MRSSSSLTVRVVREQASCVGLKLYQNSISIACIRRGEGASILCRIETLILWATCNVRPAGGEGASILCRIETQDKRLVTRAHATW